MVFCLGESISVYKTREMLLKAIIFHIKYSICEYFSGLIWNHKLDSNNYFCREHYRIVIISLDCECNVSSWTKIERCSCHLVTQPKY